MEQNFVLAKQDDFKIDVVTLHDDEEVKLIAKRVDAAIKSKRLSEVEYKRMLTAFSGDEEKRLAKQLAGPFQTLLAVL